MTPVEIPLSEANTLGDFPKAVADYIKALEAHRFTEGVPAPTAHPLVERAVLRVQHPVEAVHQPVHTYTDEAGEEVTEPVGEPVRFVSSTQPDDFVPNYVLIDDTPPPPSLDERKAELASNWARQAENIVNEVSPPLKRGLWALQRADAGKVPEELRTPEQKAAIAQADARSAKVHAVQRHLAQLHSDIHDLTAETIDAWKPAPFPG